MARLSFKPALTLKGRRFKWLGGFTGKPFHPPLTDITIGAYTIAPIFDVVAYLFQNKSWTGDLYRAAGLVFLIGAVSSVATTLTGFNDWLMTQKGTQIRRMANAHAWTMIVMTLVVAANLWTRFVSESGATYPSVTVLALSLGILLLSVVGGTIGGSMVYDFGMNVEIADQQHHVYQVSEVDVIHPHDKPRT